MLDAVTPPAHETAIRVRYGEVDRMGFVHHSRYLDYFEQARTELLRSLGRSYRDIEDGGLLLVVAEVEMRFHRPARYDDLLTVRTRLASSSGARVVFEYEVERPSDGTRIATGRTTLASTDVRGRPVRVPEGLSSLLSSSVEAAPAAGRKAAGSGAVQGRP
jgi:acyl-CoA thioester hydrolase